MEKDVISSITVMDSSFPLLYFVILNLTYLHLTEYCVRYRDGTAKRTLLASIPEVMSLLTSEFGITQIEKDSTYRSNLATHIEPFFNRGAPTTFHSSSYAT